jgi:hypothetical protein
MLVEEGLMVYPTGQDLDTDIGIYVKNGMELL